MATTDPQREAAMQRKLDKIAKLSRELEAEAQEVYGRDAWVFCEADGHLHVMAGDEIEDRYASSANRQKFIRLTSNGLHRLGAGAW